MVLSERRSRLLRVALVLQLPFFPMSHFVGIDVECHLTSFDTAWKTKEASFSYVLVHSFTFLCIFLHFVVV